MEKQEEKEKKKMQEKVKATNKNAISANVDLTGNVQLCLRYMKQMDRFEFEGCSDRFKHCKLLNTVWPNSPCKVLLSAMS